METDRSCGGLIIVGVVALVRSLRRGDRSMTARPTPEQMLAERFAGGEIEEREYRERLDVVRDGARPRVEP